MSPFVLILYHLSVEQFVCTSFFSFSRDSVMEILFEQDNEEKSVASLILDALVKVQKNLVVVSLQHPSHVTGRGWSRCGTNGPAFHLKHDTFNLF